jgi:hypothetical protein
MPEAERIWYEAYFVPPSELETLTSVRSGTVLREGVFFMSDLLLHLFPNMLLIPF